MNISNNEHPTPESDRHKNISLSNSYLSQYGLKKDHPGYPAINVTPYLTYLHLYIAQTNPFRLDKHN